MKIMKRELKFLLIISLLVVLTITSPSVLLSNYSILPAISSSPPLSLLPTIIQTARADVDIDTSGNGKAAAKRSSTCFHLICNWKRDNRIERSYLV